MTVRVVCVPHTGAAFRRRRTGIIPGFGWASVSRVTSTDLNTNFRKRVLNNGHEFSGLVRRKVT